MLFCRVEAVGSFEPIDRAIIMQESLEYHNEEENRENITGFLENSFSQSRESNTSDPIHSQYSAFAKYFLARQAPGLI